MLIFVRIFRYLMLVCDPYIGSDAMRKSLLIVNLFALYGQLMERLQGGVPTHFQRGLMLLLA